MKTLEGTEKQIAYAESIRSQFFREVKNSSGTVLAASPYEICKIKLIEKANGEKNKIEVLNILESATEISSAKFWIDNSSVFCQEMTNFSYSVSICLSMFKAIYDYNLNRN